MDKSALLNLMNNYRWLHEMLKNMPPELFVHWEFWRYYPEELVCEQGDQPDVFFIVIEGRLKVEHILEDGTVLIIAYLHQGQMISDIEIALETPYICRITAESQASALVLKKNIYQKWLLADNHFLLYLTKQFAGKLQETVRKSIDNVSMSLKHKLLRYLYGQVEHINFNQQASFIIPISREDIASQWGVTLRSVNRVLKELKDREIIYVDKNRIICNEWSRFLLKKELRYAYDARETNGCAAASGDDHISRSIRERIGAYLPWSNFLEVKHHKPKISIRENPQASRGFRGYFSELGTNTEI
ncbi:Crp/Fnr family transcriptional regulator [Paenibacillus jiagnxiensis]|uniref:Crp/Fnr family transcriptional regulator n=1 Tax=Paenibacillus jiagnxiensis TaxID=3228926 RepID=UPI0033A34D06